MANASIRSKWVGPIWGGGPELQVGIRNRYKTNQLMANLLARLTSIAGVIPIANSRSWSVCFGWFCWLWVVFGVALAV